LFLSDGTPVRATVDITLKEYWDPKEQGGRLKSANFSKQHVASQGETLAGIAARYYDNPALWRKIAEANNIDNPRSLQPSQVLEIPAIE
jgi:nucleoid-associated protein YgaU